MLPSGGHVSKTQPSLESNDVKHGKDSIRFELYTKGKSWNVLYRIVSDNSPNICLLDLLGSALNTQPQAITTPLAHMSEVGYFPFH